MGIRGFFVKSFPPFVETPLAGVGKPLTGVGKPLAGVGKPLAGVGKAIDLGLSLADKRSRFFADPSPSRGS